MFSTIMGMYPYNEFRWLLAFYRFETHLYKLNPDEQWTSTIISLTQKLFLTSDTIDHWRPVHRHFLAACTVRWDAIQRFASVYRELAGTSKAAKDALFEDMSGFDSIHRAMFVYHLARDDSFSLHKDSLRKAFNSIDADKQPKACATFFAVLVPLMGLSEQTPEFARGLAVLEQTANEGNQLSKRAHSDLRKKAWKADAVRRTIEGNTEFSIDKQPISMLEYFSLVHIRSFLQVYSSDIKLLDLADVYHNKDEKPKLWQVCELIRLHAPPSLALDNITDEKMTKAIILESALANNITWFLSFLTKSETQGSDIVNSVGDFGITILSRALDADSVEIVRTIANHRDLVLCQGVYAKLQEASESNEKQTESVQYMLKIYQKLRMSKL